MNLRKSIVTVGLAAALLLTGCEALQLGVETATPTDRPPTVVTPVVTAAVTASPAAATQPPAASATAGPTLAPATQAPATSAATEPTLAVSNTPEAAPSSAPTAADPTLVPGQPQVNEAILILTPGDNSTVASPVRVSGQADPTFEQNLVVQIEDVDGAVLATQATTIHGDAVRGPFEVQVPFTILQAGPGRISVYSTSARDGGLIHLASTDVMLTPGSAPEPAANQPDFESITIDGGSFSGGSLHISGYSDYVFESQLSFVLCGEGGSGAPEPVCGTTDNTLASGTAMLNSPDVGQPGPYAGDLTYQISAPVHARMVVFSRSPRDGGIVHLTSAPIDLTP